MTDVFKALADPTRREVLDLLKAGPMTAGQLAGHFVVSGPTMSAHFKILKEAGLVHSERQGKNVIYHLRLSVLEDALLGLADQFNLFPQKNPRTARFAAGKSRQT